MKKISLTLSLTLIALFMFSQQKEGKVVYERTSQMQLRMNDNNQGEQVIPRTRIDKFVLLFGNNQSLWHLSDEQLPEDEAPAGGIQIRMIGGGTDDITFCDFSKANTTEQREMFDKKFIISDSIRKLNWKLTGETKSILNHACQQAIAQRPGTRVMMNMENGKMERKEISDTSEVIAWFAMDIPVSAGPAEFQGQLPGLVLQLDINKGKQIYTATDLSLKGDNSAIKEPRNGKKVTREEFKKETQKMMSEMEKNNGGQNRQIRISN